MNRLWQLKALLITGLVFTLASKGGCMDEVEMDDGVLLDIDTGNDTGTDALTETDTQGAALKVISGVDILMVVDNSSSMAEEQAILSSEIYALITKLIKPLQGAVYKALPEIRLALASTDMGLHVADGTPIPADLMVATCTDQGRNSYGDNGAFLGKHDDVRTVVLEDSRIECDADGSQCPNTNWSCQGGLCVSPGGGRAINCPTVAGNSWIEYSADDPNPDLAVQAACMAMQGTMGCGIEQQLKSSVHALQNHPDFLNENHALLVLVVSDEEDCSIENGELLQTEQFQDQKQLNTACSLPAQNEDYLIDALTIKEQLIALKGGAEENVYFAAIVGVPNREDSPCIGFGDQVSAKGCLDDPTMEFGAKVFQTQEGNEYTHFAPACERHDDYGLVVTSARPGRRFVELAQTMGQQSYVQSICDANWSGAVNNIAEELLQRHNATLVK